MARAKIHDPDNRCAQHDLVSRIAQEGERLCRRIRLSPERPPLSRISTGASGPAGPTGMWPHNLRVAWRSERIEWWAAECSRRANEVKVDLAIVNSPTARPARPGTSTFASCVSRPSNSKADRSDVGELPMKSFVVFQIARQISSSNVRHLRCNDWLIADAATVLPSRRQTALKSAVLEWTAGADS